MAKLLLDDHSYDASAVDSEGSTPLALAVAGSHASTVEVLLERGASAAASGPRGPLLLAACTTGDAEVAELLLAAGADPGCTSPDGISALFIAAAMAALKGKLPGREQEAAGALRCVEALLQAGADPNVSAPGGFTPLHVAAECGNEAMLSALLQAGADNDARNSEGQTPAAVAASWGHRSAAELLLRHPQSRQSGHNEDAAQSVDDLMGKMELEAAERRQANEDAAAERAVPSPVPQPEDRDEAKSEQLKAEGNAFFVAGRYEEAAVSYRAALRHWTGSASLWANSAAAALKLGRHGDALRDARLARTVDPKSVKAWYREGQAAGGLEMWEDAAAAYFEAHLLQPEGSGGVDFGQLVKAAADQRSGGDAEAEGGRG